MKRPQFLGSGKTMDQKNSPVRYLLPRLQDLIFVLVFYFVLLVGTGLFRDGDPGRHIIFGQYMIEHLTIPTKDFFSFTIYGSYVPPYAWLSEIFFGGSYMLMGLNGVVLLSALLISIAILLVYKEMLRRRIPKFLAFLLAAWVAINTMSHWLARPHLFSFILLTIFTSMLARLTSGEKVPWWQFPLVMLVWANMHATYFTGFITWFAFLAGAVWESWASAKKLLSPMVKTLLLIGVTMFAATFINPSTYHVWTSIVGYASNKFLVDLISETRSVDFHQFGSFPFLFTLTGALFLLGVSKQKRPVAEYFLIAGWAAMGLYGGRNAILFAIVAVPLLAEHIKPFFLAAKPLEKFNRGLETLEKQLAGFVWPAVAVIAVVVLLIAGVKLDAQKQGYHFNTAEFPVQAVDWIEAHPQNGNMFNYFPWGGYLIYRLWPDYKVFIDGNLLYPVSLIRQHQQVLNAEPGWENVIAQYDIQWMLVPADEPISRLLPLHPDWEIVYQDETAIIARRR
jgi:hypothetical protein